MKTYTKAKALIFSSLLLCILILSASSSAQQDSAVATKGLVRSMICLLFQAMPALIAIALIAGGAMLLTGGADRRNSGKGVIKNAFFAFVILIALMFFVSVALPDIEIGSCFQGSILENQAPIAEARVGYAEGSLEKKVEATVGDAVYFDATLSKDVDGSITKYSWTFGDGAGEEGDRVQHTYTSPGEYIAELLVTDNAGLVCRISSRATVVVNPGLSVNKSVELLEFDKPASGSGIEVDYIVRDPEIEVAFVGNAMFGTPCPGPEYYKYGWYLNKSLIGDTKEFVKNSTDFSAGRYTLTLNVSDCLGRTAVSTSELYVVEKLNASIRNITVGGVEIYQTYCSASSCNLTACNPGGTRNATDIYQGNKEYFYNRTITVGGRLLELTYDGSLIYRVDDPEVEVLYPSKCADCDPHGFYTILRENSSGEYFVLIGEDDFIGGMPAVSPPFCKEVCTAFMDDFIPIVSEILMCGAKKIDGPSREHGTDDGYTVVDAQNGPDRVHFIFADNMAAFFADKGWGYKSLETRSGMAQLTISSFCFIANVTNHTTETCPINFSGMVTGGLPPYTVRWVSSDDGLFDKHIVRGDPGVYDLITTPPMSPPLTEGLHDISLYAVDRLGLSSNSSYEGAQIQSCCAIGTPCHTYWPGREGPLVNTGNEVSYGCDIYEVCRPELWDRAREAAYCCKTDCLGVDSKAEDGFCDKQSDGTCDRDCKEDEDLDCRRSKKCHSYCEDILNNWTGGLRQEDGSLSAEGVKKCSALYLIEGFGPMEKYMTDYFYPETCMIRHPLCAENCCPQFDMGRCQCCWHSYNREASSLPEVGAVSFSSGGWASDIAMNKNSCDFFDLPAYASMEVINTGTCCDYANALTTVLRIAGYANDEVYSVSGPGHCYNLVKLPGESSWNLVDTTGNKKVPYVPDGTPPGSYPYCSYSSCRNDAGQAECPNEPVYGC